MAKTGSEMTLKCKMLLIVITKILQHPKLAKFETTTIASSSAVCPTGEIQKKIVWVPYIF